MPIELRWKASFSASCLHAATCLHEGLPVANPELAATLEPARQQLARECEACGLSADSFFPLLVELSAEFENNRQLIARAAARLRGSGSVGDTMLSRLAGCLADLEAALLRQQPRLVDELAVRGRPLREQWEARGPGLLRQMAKLTDESLLAPAAEVVLVAPFVGGHGRAHLQTNQVTFEAVLANPHPDLPEVLRLAWLLAQLQLDLPRFSDSIPGDRLPLVARLATLPAVLAAAEAVELAAYDAAMQTRALECWHLPAEVDQRLHSWWSAYYEGTPRWSTALAALDAMLA